MIPYAAKVRLEKAAADNGFDRALGATGDWLAFGSNHAPLRVWLGTRDPESPVVALSRADVERALRDLGATETVPLPEGAAAARMAPGFDVLHELLRRAYQLARTLPDELLHAFEEKTKNLPRETEAARLVIQRVGQDLFRAGLIEYWDGRCAVTGLAVPELLRASHIKPWAACDSDTERLDVFNGLLLAPHLDAAFDQGFITIADDGLVVLARALPTEAEAVLGLDASLRVTRLASGHLRYLPWHREKVFKG